MNTFKQEMGEEALKELEKIVKRTIDIRNITDAKDFEIKKEAISMLMRWINQVYSLTTIEKQIIEDTDIDFDKMYKVIN